MQTATLLLASAAALLSVVHSPAPAAGPTLPSGKATIETVLPYLVTLPPGYDDDKTDTKEGGHGWPMVLFLHGSGERGDGDVQRVADTGLPALVKNGKTYPFVMVAPQCATGGAWQSGVLRDFVLQMQKQYGTDPDRLYVTGLSLGGFGTWDLICHYPDLFAAAAVPICGGGMPRFTGGLKTLPIWAFHGEKDPVVSAQLTRDMVSAVQSHGNPNVKMTIFPDLLHDCWTHTYGRDYLFDWMLAQRRPAATTTPAKKPAA